MKLVDIQQHISTQCNFDWNSTPMQNNLQELAQVLQQLLTERGAAQPDPALCDAAVEHELYNLLSEDEQHDYDEAVRAWATERDGSSTAELIAQALVEVRDSAAGTAAHLISLRGADTKMWHDDPAITLDPCETLRIHILAQLCALLGCPLASADTSSPLLHWITASENSTSWICIPQYHWGSNDRTELRSVIVVARARHSIPLTQQHWLRTLHLAGHAGFFTVLDEDVKGADIFRPLACNDQTPQAWDSQLHVLSRENMRWLPEAHADDLHTIEQWLAQHILALGLPTPSEKMTDPEQLKTQLFAHLDRNIAESFSTTSQASAAALSEEAKQGNAERTVAHMLYDVQQVLRTQSIPLMAYAGYSNDGQFTLQTSLTETLDAADAQILRILAQASALQAQATHTMAAVSSLLHQWARERLGLHDHLITIPVYRWDAARRSPVFHGIFIAVRDGDAAAHSTAEWLQWQFVCQCMSLPLDTLGSVTMVPRRFRPVHVGTSQVVATQMPERFLIPASIPRCTPADRPQQA